jgi:hypothetical protein
VKKGKKTCICSTWSECKEQIDGVDKPVFRKFHSLEDAQKFIGSKSSHTFYNKPAPNKTGTQDLERLCLQRPLLIQMFMEMRWPISLPLLAPTLINHNIVNYGVICHK